MNLAGDDPEHAVVVPGGLLAPTVKAGLMAAIAGDEFAGGGAMAHPTVILFAESLNFCTRQLPGGLRSFVNVCLMRHWLRRMPEAPVLSCHGTVTIDI